MKILHLTSHLNVGGITRYILSLSKQLMERGHTVIIASDRGSTEYQLKDRGIVHWRLPFHTSAALSPKVYFGMKQLERLLLKEPVDIIHAHTRVSQVVADQVSRRTNIPYVTTWHGLYKPRLGRKLWPCVGNLTISISRPVRQKLIQDFHVPDANIRDIYNGIDVKSYADIPKVEVVEAYRKHWQLSADQPIIGGIGRLAAGEVKGFDLLLIAAYLLKDEFPGIQVLIVGDGPRRPFLEDVARRLGLEDAVHFAGETKDIRVALAAMDVFVFSSRWPEAFGLTIVEAMAASKPIVATRVGAVEEVIRDGIDGWTVPVNDVSLLAEKIKYFLKNRELGIKCGIAAQVRASSLFSVERMTREIEIVYQELIHSRHPVSGV